MRLKKHRENWRRENPFKKLDDVPGGVEVLNEVNLLLQGELDDLGIEEKVNILPDQFMILSNAEYPKAKTGTIFHKEGMIVLKEDDIKSRVDLFYCILHESIHLQSFLKIHLRQFDGKVKDNIHRSGYIMHNIQKDHHHFGGLNEAVTDGIVREIVRKHGHEIIQRLRLDESEQKESFRMYYGFLKVLDTIIKGVAENKKEEKETAWRRLKRGIFTGEVLHLREIEKAFGKGSLKALGAMNFEKEDDKAYEKSQKVLKYFLADNQEEKDSIAKEILGEKEFTIYLNQKKTN